MNAATSTGTPNAAAAVAAGPWYKRKTTLVAGGVVAALIIVAASLYFFWWRPKKAREAALAAYIAEQEKKKADEAAAKKKADDDAAALARSVTTAPSLTQDDVSAAVAAAIKQQSAPAPAPVAPKPAPVAPKPAPVAPKPRPQPKPKPKQQLRVNPALLYDWTRDPATYNKPDIIYVPGGPAPVAPAPAPNAATIKCAGRGGTVTSRCAVPAPPGGSGMITVPCDSVDNFGRKATRLDECAYPAATLAQWRKECKDAQLSTQDAPPQWDLDLKECTASKAPPPTKVLDLIDTFAVALGGDTWLDPIDWFSSSNGSTGYKTWTIVARNAVGGKFPESATLSFIEGPGRPLNLDHVRTGMWYVDEPTTGDITLKLSAANLKPHDVENSKLSQDLLVAVKAGKTFTLPSGERLSVADAKKLALFTGRSADASKVLADEKTKCPVTSAGNWGFGWTDTSTKKFSGCVKTWASLDPKIVAKLKEVNTGKVSGKALTKDDLDKAVRMETGPASVVKRDNGAALSATDRAIIVAFMKAAYKKQFKVDWTAVGGSKTPKTVKDLDPKIVKKLSDISASAAPSKTDLEKAIKMQAGPLSVLTRDDGKTALTAAEKTLVVNFLKTVYKNKFKVDFVDTPAATPSKLTDLDPKIQKLLGDLKSGMLDGKKLTKKKLQTMITASAKAKGTFAGVATGAAEQKLINDNLRELHQTLFKTPAA
jgi:hypothetical protein